MAEKETIRGDTLSDEEKNTVRTKYCRYFYITLIDQIQERFDFSDEYFEISQILLPANARKLQPNSLFKLFTRFPVLGNTVRRSLAETEWRAHANLKPNVFRCSCEDEIIRMDAKEYWAVVLNLKAERKPGCLMYPNLAVCMQFLLTMPSSNASSERAFSTLKEIKTDKRNCLHNVTVSILIRIKNWLKANDATASTAIVNDKLIESVLSVKANAAIQEVEDSIEE